MKWLVDRVHYKRKKYSNIVNFYDWSKSLLVVYTMSLGKFFRYESCFIYFHTFINFILHLLFFLGVFIYSITANLKFGSPNASWIVLGIDTLGILDTNGLKVFDNFLYDNYFAIGFLVHARAYFLNVIRISRPQEDFDKQETKKERECTNLTLSCGTITWQIGLNIYWMNNWSSATLMKLFS